MGFLKLNRWKILGRFCLSVTIWSVIGFVFYLSIRAHDNKVDRDAVQIMLTVLYGFAIAFFMIFFLGNWYYFYKSRTLLSYVLNRGVFDNNEYTVEYLYKKIWLLYTDECVYGNVDGYPAIVNIDMPFTRDSTPRLHFHVFITNKLNSITRETISFPIKNGLLPENFKHDVVEFVSKFKSKGYEKANISTGQEASEMIGLAG